jgi:hypothetical protein
LRGGRGNFFQHGGDCWSNNAWGGIFFICIH